MSVRRNPAVAALLLALLGAPVLAAAQEAAPSAPEPAPVPAAVESVRKAWLVPEGDLPAILGAPRFSLDEFAVAAMVSHAAGKPVAEAEARRSEVGSWAEVIRALGGPLADAVFKGSPRYHMDPLPPREPGSNGADAEARIVTLAQVMTLERLTGDGPGTILAELQKGATFETLLAPASPPGPPAPKPRREGRPGGRKERGPLGGSDGTAAPPGIDPQTPPPGVHGLVGGAPAH